MPVNCERCAVEMDTGGGLLQRLLSTRSGYQCGQCGTVLCVDCYNERRRELLGAGSHKQCSVCSGGILEPR